MAKARKDPKGRALRTGETYRKYDGMYIYKYTDPFGKKSYVYSKNLSKLREKEEQLKRDQLDGLDLYTMRIATINFVFDRYISSKTELRSTTFSNYMYTYDHFIREEFGTRKIAEVKFSDVLQFYKHLVDDKGLAIGTLDNVHSVLHPTFELAVRDDIIRNNPSNGVMAEMKKKWGRSTGVRHALTMEQQEAFMKCLDMQEHIRWRPIFTVLLGTGCRIGEVIGLRWEDIDMENRLININHAVTYYPRKKDSYVCEFEVSLPKTEAGVRTVPMLPAVYDAFLEEKELQEVLDICCDVELNGMSNFIFCNRFGKLHNPQALNRVIKRITEDYNTAEVVRAKREKREPILIPHFSCHHLRHTFCTRFCENETNVKVIQSVMGHADISTTLNIYAEATDRAKKESFENLARNLDVFGNKRKSPDHLGATFR